MTRDEERRIAANTANLSALRPESLPGKSLPGALFPSSQVLRHALRTAAEQKRRCGMGRPRRLGVCRMSVSTMTQEANHAPVMVDEALAKTPSPIYFHLAMKIGDSRRRTSQSIKTLAAMPK
jgi:hypothetical protein